jgi:hypothetical protein
MSSVVISGDSSGAITLAAPAVAGTNTITLPANTGTVITTASTFSGTGPAFSAYKSVTQSISSATQTKITFETEEFDTNNNFASSRFTPTVAGYYQVQAQFQPNAVYSAGTIGIYKNGSAYKYGSYNANATGVATPSMSCLVYLNGSTDYIEVYGYLTVGQEISYATTGLTWFQGCLVRSA